MCGLRFNAGILHPDTGSLLSAESLSPGSQDSLQTPQSQNLQPLTRPQLEDLETRLKPSVLPSGAGGADDIGCGEQLTLGGVLQLLEPRG